MSDHLGNQRSMPDNSSAAKSRKIVEFFSENGEWILAALQNHKVIDELTAFDFVDLNDDELIDWMNEALLMVIHRSLEVRWDCARGLRESLEKPPSRLTEEYQHVVVALVEGMLGLEDFETQLCAAYVLSIKGRDAAAAVPILLRGLRKRDATIKYTAVEALGDIGPSAKEALSKLQSIGNKSLDRELRRAAWDAIQRIQSR